MKVGTMKTAIIIDDSLYMRTIIRDYLIEFGYVILAESSNGEDGLDLAFEMQPNLIILDNILPDMLGIDMLDVFTKEKLSSKILMISAVGQDSVISKSVEYGASGYIVKPFTKEILKSELDRIFN